MPDVISINNHKIGLGEQAKIRLNIARLPTYTNIDLPVHVYRAKNDGPVLLLTGGLHGDEINGIEIIRRMIVKELLMPERGTVIAMPLVNVYGFIQSSRGVPDGKDINRCFPGVKGGSLARLLAYTLMNEIIPQIDVGIDFHTGGAARSNFPQIRSVLDIPENLELARMFSAPVTLHSPLIDKSFRKAAFRKGKHILVYEAGEANRFYEYGITEGINGTLRVMKNLNMLKEAPQAKSTQIYRKSTWIRAKYAGLFQPRALLGEEAKKRQLLGKITDPFGNESFKTVNPYEGKIICMNNAPVIHKGDALVHLAYNRI